MGAKRSYVLPGLRKGLTLLPLVIVHFLSLCPHPGSTHLRLLKVCGEVTCQEHEYCRAFDHTCNHCSIVCKEGSNNFSKDTCETECQDFIHDERYIKLQSGADVSQDIGALFQSLQKDLVVLKILVGVCLVVVGVIVASFIAFLVYFWRYIYQGSTSKSGNEKSNPTSEKGSSKKGEKPLELPVIYNNKYGICNSPDLRRREHSNVNDDDTVNQSPSKTSTTETLNSINTGKVSRTTVSTIVNSNSSSTNGLNKNRREPSESTIPEYMAYDNASMSHGQGQAYTHHV